MERRVNLKEKSTCLAGAVPKDMARERPAPMRAKDWQPGGIRDDAKTTKQKGHRNGVAFYVIE
ncbi:hypothetical protein [Aeromonas taiwanensis]|nr:hypothetical protein [Aeromonas taiwanensis]